MCCKSLGLSGAECDSGEESRELALAGLGENGTKEAIICAAKKDFQDLKTLSPGTMIC